MPSTHHTASRLARLTLAFLLLVCFAGFQTAAAITGQVHTHHESHNDCCQICHAGHASAIQPALAFVLAAPLIEEWRNITETAAGTADCRVQLRPSRAPPR